MVQFFHSCVFTQRKWDYQLKRLTPLSSTWFVMMTIEKQPEPVQVGERLRETQHRHTEWSVTRPLERMKASTIHPTDLQIVTPSSSTTRRRERDPFAKHTVISSFFRIRHTSYFLNTTHVTIWWSDLRHKSVSFSPLPIIPINPKSFYQLLHAFCSQMSGSISWISYPWKFPDDPP